MVDKGGNIVIPSVYQERFRFDNNQLACVRWNGDNNKWLVHVLPKYHDHKTYFML